MRKLAKLLLPIVFISLEASATTIPIKEWDEIKLTDVFSRVPAILVTEESYSDNSKMRTWDLNLAPGYFRITCTGTYFEDAPLPSLNDCSWDFDENFRGIERKGDEWIYSLTDLERVNQFREAIGHGQALKGVYSTERIYGKDRRGYRRQIFRYSIVCSETTCTFAWSSLPAQD